MQNNKNLTTVLIVVGAIILGLIIWALVFRGNNSSNNPIETVETFDQNVSDGTIKAVYSSGDFALAERGSPLPIQSYIPPCRESFDYCIYYKGDTFEGTNFESAGLSITKRPDLKTETTCMETPPEGYKDVVFNTKIPRAEYTTDEFEGLGNEAGAGHVAEGSVYRLFYKKTSSCYELQTRVGYSQFANHEPGSIKEFTEENKEVLKVRLQNILSNISVPNGDTNIFP